jgi:hypothetical protein
MNDMDEKTPNESESLNFSQKMDLVRDVFQAAETRNQYPSTLKGSPDFDTFAESYGNFPEYRGEYERLSGIFVRLRKNVEDTIGDKEEFAKTLEESGETELAEKFRRMFL